MNIILYFVLFILGMALGTIRTRRKARVLMDRIDKINPPKPIPCAKCINQEKHRYLVWEVANPANLWTCQEIGQPVALAQIDQQVMVVDTVGQWVFAPGGWRPIAHRPVAERPYGSIEEADASLRKYWDKKSGGRL